jgi:phenylacetate-CoA ligase
LRYWKELEITQFLPEAEVLEIQWKRLAHLLQFAYASNAFYRRRFDGCGITPEHIKEPSHLRLVPVLTKEEIQRNTYDMISCGFEQASLLNFRTGGSTGKSLELFITEECSELRNACAYRHDRWSGWEIGEPVAALWGNPKLPRSLNERFKSWLLSPRIYLDTMAVTEQSVRRFAVEWDGLKPTLLFGHAHSIYMLAWYLDQLGIDTIHPKGIISTSMMLLDHERKFIERFFGISITDRYGCEEVSLIASECERHSGMHLNIEHLYVEFLTEDGRVCEAGEPGQIVVTDLMNRAMPLIRYKVEDVGIPTSRRCVCGRGLPLMEKVVGRVADFLIKRDGTKIAGVSLIENTLTRIPGIQQMQIVQDSFDLLTLIVVGGSEFGLERQASLVDYFTNLFGLGTEVRLNLVEKIQPELSGKYRFSICNVHRS